MTPGFCGALGGTMGKVNRRLGKFVYWRSNVERPEGDGRDQHYLVFAWLLLFVILVLLLGFILSGGWHTLLHP